MIICLQAKRDYGAMESRAEVAEFLESLSALLVQAAYSRSVSRVAFTPFQKSAQDNLFQWQGGKRDDITVLVSMVVDQGKFSK